MTTNTYQNAANQDYVDMMSYSDYMGSLAGQPDYNGGCTSWMEMSLMFMMLAFEGDSIGAEAFIDKQINDIKYQTDTLTQDLNAGKSNPNDYDLAADGTTKMYYTMIDGKKYYTNARDVGTTTQSGYTVQQSDTLQSKIDKDVEDLKKSINSCDYFTTQNPTAGTQMIDTLDSFQTSIDHQYDGNIQQLWQDTDPAFYNPDTTQLGDPSSIQALTNDLSEVQSQCTTADSVMQEVIKQMTSTYQAIEGLMNSFSDSVSQMETYAMQKVTI
ncbi:MAG: hypothetical protein FJZ56_02550 [Chlamydiae bacterium]|nr:hypothetical protein [Chlamydiota bacterium]